MPNQVSTAMIMAAAGISPKLKVLVAEDYVSSSSRAETLRVWERALSSARVPS